MSVVLSLRQLRSLPNGFRQRFESSVVTSADVAALRRLGIRLAQIRSIRSERRADRIRPVRPVTVVVPASRAEAQLMNYFKKQDFIAPYNEWPEGMRRLSIRPVKDDRTRFLMAVYYALHGLSPQISREFILASRVARGHLVRGPYNEHQLDHMDRVLVKVQDPGFLRRYSRLSSRE